MAATARCSCRLHNADAHAVSSAEAGAPSGRDWSRHRVGLRLGPTHRHPRLRRPSICLRQWLPRRGPSRPPRRGPSRPPNHGRAPVASHHGRWPRSGPETAPCCSMPSGLRLLLPKARGRQPPRPHSRRPYGRSSQKPPSAASSRPLGLTAIFSQGETVHEKDWSTGLIRLCKFCRNDLIFSVN